MGDLQLCCSVFLPRKLGYCVAPNLLNRSQPQFLRLSAAEAVL